MSSIEEKRVLRKWTRDDVVAATAKAIEKACTLKETGEAEAGTPKTTKRAEIVKETEEAEDGTPEATEKVAIAKATAKASTAKETHKTGTATTTANTTATMPLFVIFASGQRSEFNVTPNQKKTRPLQSSSLVGKSHGAVRKRPSSDYSDSPVAKKLAIMLDEKRTPPPRHSCIPESLHRDRIPITHGHRTHLVDVVNATKFHRPICRLIQLSQHKSGKPTSSLLKIFKDGITANDLHDDLAWDLSDYLHALHSDNPEVEQFAEELEETAKMFGFDQNDKLNKTKDSLRCSR